MLQDTYRGGGSNFVKIGTIVCLIVFMGASKSGDTSILMQIDV